MPENWAYSIVICGLEVQANQASRCHGVAPDYWKCATDQIVNKTATWVLNRNPASGRRPTNKEWAGDAGSPGGGPTDPATASWAKWANLV